jgi:iron complex outermembrane receptor protein
MTTVEFAADTELHPVRAAVGCDSAAGHGVRRQPGRLAMLLAASALSTLVGAGAASAADTASLASAAAPVEASASGAVDAAVQEVVVTARHRTEDAQKVPVALTVLNGALLAKTNTTTIAQVSQLVPSLQFTFFNARNANINVRGLGNSIGLANDGLDPGVAFYVDGVYYSRPATATLDLIGIDQIEVLRGPQGTLFGKNTTAGAIVVNTVAPAFKPAATLEVSGGNYGYGQAKASLSGPIIADKLAASITGAYTYHDGYLTNIYSGKRVDNYRNETIRGQLLFTPTSDLKFRLIGDYSNQFTHCCISVLSGIVAPPNGKNFVNYANNFGYSPVVDPFARQADANAPFRANQETGGVSLEGDWSLPKFTLTSLTAWRFWNWWPQNDGDNSPLPILNIAQNGDYENQYTQEFRIASAGKNFVDYVGGLYFYREQMDAVGVTQYGADASYFLLGPAVPAYVANNLTNNIKSGYNTDSFAAFGQAVWHVTDKLNLTGGVRYTLDEKHGNFNQVTSGAAPFAPGTPAKLIGARQALGYSTEYAVTSNKSAVSGLANLSYQFTPAFLAYANYSHGYKSGGLNLAQLPAGASEVVQPESVDAAEIGLKSAWFEHRVTLNGDLFWEQDNQYQANVVDPILLKMYLANVPQVRSQGVEVDIQAQPTDDLSLYASATFEDAIYAKFPTAPCGLEHANLATCNLDGRQLPGVPRWALTAGGEYDYPFTLGSTEAQAYVGVDYTYRSGENSAATDSVYTQLAPLSLVNARLGIRSRDQRWDVYIWSKNLGAAKYFTYTQPGSGNTGALYSQIGDPQTFGATVRVKY